MNDRISEQMVEANSVPVSETDLKEFFATHGITSNEICDTETETFVQTEEDIGERAPVSN